MNLTTRAPFESTFQTTKAWIDELMEVGHGS
jgi:hypothetical protein